MNKFEVARFSGQKVTKVMQVKEGVFQILLELNRIRGPFLPPLGPPQHGGPNKGHGAHPWNMPRPVLSPLGSGSEGGCVCWGASRPGLPWGSLDSWGSAPLLPSHPVPPMSPVTVWAPSVPGPASSAARTCLRAREAGKKRRQGGGVTPVLAAMEEACPGEAAALRASEDAAGSKAPEFPRGLEPQPRQLNRKIFPDSSPRLRLHSPWSLDRVLGIY